MPHRYDTDYKIGQDNIRAWGMDLHNPVFLISSFLVLVFVIGTIMFPGEAKTSFDGAKGWSIEHLDWRFSVAGNLFVLFCVALIVMAIGSLGMVAPVPGGIGAYHFIVKAVLVELYFVSSESATSFATILHGSQTLLLIAMGVFSYFMFFLLRRRKAVYANA